ncbi:SatD family protein [Microbacterium binotii]|uniref:SatD family protein n=1 Tax=Microbacterium binotii TaxID=462710 RepID=UPI001F20D83E|nr:SatD family protein [Microbacterium binotii]UIN29599.1 SatD family protein [Microbacterium binotii]
MATVVTADIIGSRALPDRTDAQRRIEAVFAAVEADLPLAERVLTATVGDEFQGEYPDLGAALASILLLTLALPDGLECRFGIGLGEAYTVDATAGQLAEGPAWWAARAAIDTLHAKQVRAMPAARTWIAAAEDEDAAVHEQVRLANAYVWARDELVSAMGERVRRLVYGRCMGLTQRELAAREQITQSAVSQLLTASGAAGLVEGFAQWRR